MPVLELRPGGSFSNPIVIVYVWLLQFLFQFIIHNNGAGKTLTLFL